MGEVAETLESQPEVTETVEPDSKVREAVLVLAESAKPESPIEELIKGKNEQQKKQDSQKEPLDVQEICVVMETTNLVHEVVKTAEQEAMLMDTDVFVCKDSKHEFIATKEPKSELNRAEELEPGIIATEKPNSEVMTTELSEIKMVETEESVSEFVERIIDRSVEHYEPNDNLKTYADIVKVHSDSVPTFCFEPEVKTRLITGETSVENEVPTSESAELLSVPDVHSKRRKRRHRSRSRNRDLPEKPTQVYEIIEPDFSDVGSDHQDSGDEVQPELERGTLVVDKDDLNKTAIVCEASIEEPSKTKKKRQKKKGKKVKQSDLVEASKPETVELEIEVTETSKQEPEMTIIVDNKAQVIETQEEELEVIESQETEPSVEFTESTELETEIIDKTDCETILTSERDSAITDIAEFEKANEESLVTAEPLKRKRRNKKKRPIAKDESQESLSDDVRNDFPLQSTADESVTTHFSSQNNVEVITESHQTQYSERTCDQEEVEAFAELLEQKLEVLASDDRYSNESIDDLDTEHTMNDLVVAQPDEVPDFISREISSDLPQVITSEILGEHGDPDTTIHCSTDISIDEQTYADIAKKGTDSYPTFCFEPDVETVEKAENIPLIPDEDESNVSKGMDTLLVPDCHPKRKKRRQRSRSRSRNRDQPRAPSMVYEIIEPDFSDVGSDFHDESGDETDLIKTMDQDQTAKELMDGKESAAIDTPLGDADSKKKKKRQRKKKENIEVEETKEPVPTDVVESKDVEVTEPVTAIGESVENLESAKPVSEVKETVLDVADNIESIPE